MNEDVSIGIKTIIEKMNQGFNLMNQKFKEMNQRFEEVNQRFEEVNQRFEEVNQRFEEVNQKFDRVDQRFKEVNERLDRHEQRLDGHDKRFEEMQRTLVIIEDQVTNKIPALFDGYNANHELYKELEKRVDRLEEKENFNSLKISVLEDKIG